MKRENCCKYILFIALAALVLVGCEPDKTCRQEIDVRTGLVLRCFHHDTLDIVNEVVSWDSITVQGVGNDSVLYNNTKNVKQVWLPLRGDTTITAYNLTWQGKTETLYIQHTRSSQVFVSMACGCIIFHHIEKVWCDKVWADSVVIVNSAVELPKQDNIRIYATIKD